MNTEGVKLGRALLIGSSLVALASPSFAQSTTPTPAPAAEDPANPQGEGDQIPDPVAPAAETQHVRCLQPAAAPAVIEIATEAR